MRRPLHIAFAVLASLCVAAPLGRAQDAAADDAAMRHYRAYRAALAANDWIVAEREAASAFAAAQIEAPESARNAALAANLAAARLELGRAEEAIVPAEIAYARAQAAGQDTLPARLLLARAELGAGRVAGVARASAALAEAEARSDLAGDAYVAASALGAFHFARADYEEAQTSFAAAQAFARGDEGAFARAQAQVKEGAALVMLGEHARARDALDEALAALAPFAQSNGPNGEMTAAQVARAEAQAWRALSFAARGRSAPQTLTAEAEQAANLCDVRIAMVPPPVYPREALSETRVGAVVMRFTIDSDGRITSRQAAAYAPTRDFAEAVERVAGQWRVERNISSAPSCQMARTANMTISFVID
ncbi:MAG: TonB family protein [Hyphomonadaceae bacterium]